MYVCLRVYVCILSLYLSSLVCCVCVCLCVSYLSRNIILNFTPILNATQITRGKLINELYERACIQKIFVE